MHERKIVCNECECKTSAHKASVSNKSAGQNNILNTKTFQFPENEAKWKRAHK